MVSDNTELDFGMARPVLVSGNQGLQAKGVGKSFNKRRVVRNVSLGLFGKGFLAWDQWSWVFGQGSLDWDIWSGTIGMGSLVMDL